MKSRVRNARLIVLTGKGKGKTTSAFGMALRAAGHGMRVLVVQFIKGSWMSGECEAAQRLAPYITVRRAGRGFVGADPARDIEPDRRLAMGAWRRAREDIRSGEYDMVILDEIHNALRASLLETRDVLEFLRDRPRNVHLVLTGRDAPAEIIELADTATEMQEIRHALAAGVKATRGVEF